MADELPTVWQCKPHTRAKHAILERYLKAWIPILSNHGDYLATQFKKQRSQRVLYIDGFAGPGIYANGETGSPVIAARAALGHSQQFRHPIEMLFIEARQDRHEKLTEIISPYITSSHNHQKVFLSHPVLGECDVVLGTILDDHLAKGITFGPALAFLDQFGYGDVSMDLIRRILTFPSCEVFSYLDYKGMNRWITDPDKAPAFTRAYGSDDWKKCMSLPESERRQQLLTLYESALRTRANARYVKSFLMSGSNGEPLYWLLFCTNHLRGLEEMKKAMWAVDKTGEFRFSDKILANQQTLLDAAFSPQWLADELRDKLQGRQLTAAEIREYVLTDTPCYLFRDALALLEAGQSIEISVSPVGRKPKTFPKEMLDAIVVRFQKSLF